MDVEVLRDGSRRRQWAPEEKEALLRAAFRPGAIVKVVARQNDVSTSLLYSWRRKLRQDRPALRFSQMVPLPDPVAAPPPCPPAIEIETGRGKVRIPASMPPALAAAVIGALVKR